MQTQNMHGRASHLGHHQTVQGNTTQSHQTIKFYQKTKRAREGVWENGTAKHWLTLCKRISAMLRITPSGYCACLALISLQRPPKMKQRKVRGSKMVSKISWRWCMRKESKEVKLARKWEKVTRWWTHVCWRYISCINMYMKRTGTDYAWPPTLPDWGTTAQLAVKSKSLVWLEVSCRSAWKWEQDLFYFNSYQLFCILSWQTMHCSVVDVPL